MKTKSKKPVFDQLFYTGLKKRKGQEFEMKALLRDMTVYACYTFIVMVVSYGNRDYNMLRSVATSMENERFLFVSNK